MAVAAHQRTARCPYCDSPAVVDRPERPDRPDPVFAIGFRVDRDSARRLVREFLRARRWAPRSLRRAAATRLEGIYLPTYLYTAVADSGFAATIGEDYTEVRYDARRKTTRRVRKTEWRHIEGQHSCYLSDIVVTASRGVPNSEVEAVEPFDLRDLRRYGPGMVAGWMAEEPTLSPDECLELARAESRRKVTLRLAAFQPGDHHRDLRSDTVLRQEACDLTLVPVWVVAVRHDPAAEPVRLLVNGQTGRVAGHTPVAWGTVAVWIAAGAGLLVLAWLLGQLL